VPGRETASGFSFACDRTAVGATDAQLARHRLANKIAEHAAGRRSAFVTGAQGVGAVMAISVVEILRIGRAVRATALIAAAMVAIASLPCAAWAQTSPEISL
jgi:hypothetical protein